MFPTEAPWGASSGGSTRPGGLPSGDANPAEAGQASGCSLRQAHRWTWCMGALLLLITVAVYGGVVQHGFVIWDDDLHVYENPRFQPPTWKNIGAFWRAPYEHLYVPLTYTLWAALVWLTRLIHAETLSAGLFHGCNLLLHLGSVLVVYRLGLLLMARAPAGRLRTMLAAGMGALLFALHPVQVEAVAWVSGLKDVLCGWWALIALWQYVASLGAPPGWWRRCHYGSATLALGLALLSKPAAVVVPGIAGLLAYTILEQPGRRVWRTLAGWCLVVLVWSLWTKGQQPDTAIAFVPAWWQRVVVACDALAFYLGKLLWPVWLGVDYGRTPQAVLTHGWRLLAGLLPVGLGVVLWWRQWRLPAVAATIWVVALSPVLGLVPFMFQAYSTVADRYLYLALLGPALGLMWGLQQLHGWRLAWGLSLLGVMLLGWRSTGQVQVWQDTSTLFRHTLQVNPQSALAYHNLGWSLARQGHLEAAIAHYRQALRLRPHMLEAHYNLGDALAAQGQLAEAVEHYTQVLARKPTWAEVHNNLGSALLRQGQLDRAVEHYLRALQLKPGWSLPINNLGDAMARQAKLAEAAHWFRQATQARPVLPEAPYNLGGVLWLQGQWQDAMAAYREALRRQPFWPQASNQLAWLLATQPDPSAAALAEAVALATQACHASHFRHAVPLRTLAVVYAVSGQAEAATRTAQQALALAQAANDPALLQQLTQAFEPYRILSSQQPLSEGNL